MLVASFNGLYGTTSFVRTAVFPIQLPNQHRDAHVPGPFHKVLLTGWGNQRSGLV